MAVGYPIQQAVQTLVQGLSLTDISSADVQIKELPEVGETVNPVPCVRICPYGKVGSEDFASEGSVNRTYDIEICLIDGVEGDYATDQEKYQGWHESVIRIIQKNGNDRRTRLSSVPTVWNISIVDAPTFDRSKLATNYAYQSVVARFYSKE